MKSPVTVVDIEHAIAEAFPPEWAESWDRVGLLVGDPDSVVKGVLVTLDATVESISSAMDLGANVLVSHHPATLESHSVLRPDVLGARVLFEACSRSIALVAAHTNLDRSPHGPVSLARTLGLPEGEPLESGALEECLITVYVPETSLDAVLQSASSAGAGRIGMYRGCSFALQGQGRFEGLAGSAPAGGEPGEPTVSEEVRVEFVCPASRVDAVMSAARQVHPYEEPLITASDVRVSRGVARLGRLIELSTAQNLREFAASAGESLACEPRVWGDPNSDVRRVALATGSGGSLVGAALRHEADVLIAGEVRYHDALTARSSGLSIIEVGHDVSEWPLVPVLADAVRSTVGLASGNVHVAESGRGWWST